MNKPTLTQVTLNNKEGLQKIFESLDRISADEELLECKTYIYTDQSGNNHTIIMDGSYTEEEMSKILFGIYNQIMGCGEMCLYRSNKFKLLQKKLGIKVTVLEYASVLMIVYGRLKEEYDIFNIMSKLTYHIDSAE